MVVEPTRPLVSDKPDNLLGSTLFFSRQGLVARPGIIRGKKTGELYFNADVLIRYRNPAGGYEPDQRAEEVRRRLVEDIFGKFGKDVTANDFEVKKRQIGISFVYVCVVKGVDLFTVTPKDAESAGTESAGISKKELAERWKANILRNLDEIKEFCLQNPLFKPKSIRVTEEEEKNPPSSLPSVPVFATGSVMPVVAPATKPLTQDQIIANLRGSGLTVEDYRTTLRWNPSKSSWPDKRPLKDINTLIIHHQAFKGIEAANELDIGSYLNAPHIAYHFYIKTNGTVVLCNDLGDVTWHAETANQRSIGICLEGNLQETEPTSEQKAALEKLTAELYSTLPIKIIKGHGELYTTNGTLCPGKNLMPTVKKLQSNLLASSRNAGMVYINGQPAFNVGSPDRARKIEANISAIPNFDPGQIKLVCERGGDGNKYFVLKSGDKRLATVLPSDVTGQDYTWQVGLKWIASLQKAMGMTKAEIDTSRLKLETALIGIPRKTALQFIKSYIESYKDKFIKYYNDDIDEAANRILNAVIHWAHVYGLEPMIVLSLIATESDFNPRAESPADCKGLAQLAPGTAEEMGVYGDNIWNIEENIRGGVKYLSIMYKKKGSIELALAAYNAGPGAVTDHVPVNGETEYYVPTVMRIYKQLGGKRSSKK